MEDQNIEYKESWRDEYLKWICGFANAQGGKIYIGVDDDGNVCGVKDIKSLMEDIPNKIVNTLGIVADVNKKKKGDLNYLEIIVQPSNVPISYQGKYHYRSGATKQELKGPALQQFLLKKMGQSWDGIICYGATIDDISEEAVRYFLRRGVENGRMPEKSLDDSISDVLVNLDLMDSEGQLINAAILSFGKKPSKFFPGCDFRIGRFVKGDTDLIFQDSVGGDYIRMADNVIDLLKSKYLISPIHYEGLQRIEPLEIPEDALREAIFNAIIHRDQTGAHIQMKVYNDHIELWNDGGLPEGFTIDTLLGKHNSKPRNKNLAEIFYKAGFIESWGRGIEKITEGFEKAGLKKPEFQEFCGGVLVTIPRGVEQINTQQADPSSTPQVPPKHPPQVKKLVLVISNEMTRDELQKELNITNRKYFRQNYLNKALKTGMIEMTEPDSPNSPNQKYRLTKLGKDLRKKLTDQ